ncbi:MULTISPECIES: integrase domain-containing protein [Paraburkholderia]|jgi:hypothetical protein|uniref:Phage integrase, N-terminal n=1 Tax=Paraburkholderia phenazinium TaxID=60549 RepID=A0A1N6HWT6_9BURK|nr:integrase domain-containing protein [Paraburkholderia phenazinium]SIO24284.1 Phage integrase, N-terminal [Paraburkholderia phenazinium]
MSRKGKLVHQACEVRRGPQGAFASWENTKDVWQGFARFLHERALLPRRVQDVSVAAIELYLHDCEARGVARSTVKNYATEIRVVMARLGRNVASMTNKAFGLATRCRDGKKRPPTPEELDQALTRARAVHEGFYLLLCLQELFGLRRIEVLRSTRDFETWLHLLLGGAQALPLRRGGKCGRQRRFRILEHRREETVSVLRQAVLYCRAHHGRLVEGRRKNLEGSRGSLSARYRAVGLKGEIAGHCLRYSYGHQMASAELDRGVDEHEVLLGVSTDLGHGPGRCLFTLRTYLLGLLPRFQRILNNGRLIRIPKDIADDERFRPPPRVKENGARTYWRAHIRNRRAGEGKRDIEPGMSVLPVHP